MCLLGPAAEPNLWQEHNELARATVYLQDSVSHCRANAALNATSPVLISQIKRSTPLGTPVLVSRFTWALHPQSFHTFPPGHIYNLFYLRGRVFLRRGSVYLLMNVTK